MNRNGGYIFVGLCRCNACHRYFFPNLSIAMSLITLLIHVLIKATLPNAENVLGSIKQEAVGIISLNA